MKLKTRIIVGFGMSILVPLLLFSATLYGLGHTKFAQQTKDSSEVVYDISVGESTHSQTQVRIIAKDLLFTATVILVFTALSIGLWIYRSIATPLVKLKKATQNIKEGNLDFVLEVDGDDEFSELCRDFEEMRKRLKESAEEKVLMDKENKELISNISHDLKTPITAVKGYLDSISTELDDAAKIDGCSSMKIYRLIIMPIARPMLAIIGLWSFIGPFGDYLLPKVLLNSSADYTLAAGLQTLITDERTINQPAFTAGALLTAIPIVILFVVLQKQLVSGLSNGATKG